ncbi:hypothetical protein OTK01_000375 [Caldicellulosiruptor acetigenus]|uniref:hypothetical protein n=1 Tax=Caldicellulosiruptor acetigenus TaxID=301953 RepID=UPI0022A911D0|nr:hypothetical protein [Caldicellulosiruptor acetigenus]WAM36600.1 hypothetical protein OTK01_000375 [Caldicellulosiruptor acetigenus]
MKKFLEFTKKLMKSEDGLLEIIVVGVLIVFVALKMVNPTKNLGQTLSDSFDKINQTISNQLSQITTQ